MPKKKHLESQEVQSKRFLETVGALVAAGELNPIAAAEAMEKVVKLGAKTLPESNDSSAVE